ncbi:hypothetical protein 1 [Hubei tombus-like virus 7]|uniref:hypothetical protein 1 n=1 Tax=Hubei tombus-like virus 7 TaxID=1923294 RepID=UPI00090C1999|nr:hypothetical protein 1 [Hubei tombus-like virus 7]APG76494.1 hypothetical protein 1 [Hubei tombus-like virus 7]
MSFAYTYFFQPKRAPTFDFSTTRRLDAFNPATALTGGPGPNIAPSAEGLDRLPSDNAQHFEQAPSPSVQGEGVHNAPAVGGAAGVGLLGNGAAHAGKTDAECAAAVIGGSSFELRFDAFVALCSRLRPEPISRAVCEFRLLNGGLNLDERVAMARCVEYVDQYEFRCPTIAVGALTWDDLVEELASTVRADPIEGPLNQLRPVRPRPSSPPTAVAAAIPVAVPAPELRPISWAAASGRAEPKQLQFAADDDCVPDVAHDSGIRVGFVDEPQVAYRPADSDYDDEPEPSNPIVAPSKPQMLSQQRGFFWRMLDSVLPRFTIFRQAATQLHADEVKVSFRNASVDDEPELGEVAQHRFRDVALGAVSHRKYHRAANRWHQRLRLLRQLREELIFESSEVKRVRTDANVAWIAIGARKLVAKQVEEGKIDRRHARWFRSALTETFFLKDDDDEFVDTLRGSFARAW